MSGFKPYPEYKDSRVEWLDTLPAHWEKVALKWVSRIFAGGTPDKTKTHYWENGSIPWLNSGAVNQVLVSEPSAFITTEAFNSSSARWIPSGSLVMALAGQGKTKGMVAQLAIRTTCNQSMAAITPAGNVKPRYLFWWLSNNYQNIRNMAGGDLRDGLNLELIGDIPALMPSEEEQTQIARFLDYETARIDALIEEQQRLIELLKEKRQAVISQAVTKGLDPTVPMKDSGVEWLGVVPAHWIVRKGGYIGMLFGSEAVPEDMVNESGNLPFLKVGSLSADTLSIRQWDFFVDPSIEKAYRPRSQFVVFPKRGAAIFLNKVNVVEVSALLDPNLMGWEMEAGNDAYYFANVLKCRGLAELADVSTVPQINNKHISPEKFPVPPSGEQHDIVAFLDTEVSRFDQLVTEAENGVSLLIDRRSALISAAVTGKIDVRGWQPPASAPTPELAQEAV